MIEGNTELAMEYADNALGIAKINDMILYSIYSLKWNIYFQQNNYAQAMDDKVSEWYNWYTNSKMYILTYEYLSSLFKETR